MDMAAYLVTAVLVEGRGVREVAEDDGVPRPGSTSCWPAIKAEGGAGLVPRSRRPHHSPTKMADRYEDEIVRIRKELTEAGLDAGAETIAVHLRRAHRRAIPSTTTIWRVLKARGFVTPEPHKRPKSSYVRSGQPLGPDQSPPITAGHRCRGLSGPPRQGRRGGKGHASGRAVRRRSRCQLLLPRAGPLLPGTDVSPRSRTVVHAHRFARSARRFRWRWRGDQAISELMDLGRALHQQCQADPSPSRSRPKPRTTDEVAE
jgi:hypothetical protein